MRCQLFEQFGNYNYFVVIIGIILYTLSAFSYIVYVIAMYLFKNELVPLVPLFVSGIDETHFSDFILLTCIHVTILIIAIIGMIATDTLYAIILLNVPIISKLIEIECIDLNQQLIEIPKDTFAWKGRFKKILLMHLTSKQ